MTSFSTPAITYPVQASPMLLDATRRGSKWGQVGIGVAGIVIAILLIIGQLSVAMTHGIAGNLHVNVANLHRGNQTMVRIVEKARPNVQLEKVVRSQAATLDHTRQTMVSLNAKMAQIAASNRNLIGTVSQMKTTSGKLATGVASMNANTGRINTLLGPLPAATTRTHGSLKRIAGDSHDINTELAAIGGKMQSYGLPHAKGVR